MNRIQQIHDKSQGRSALFDLFREGARQMLQAALEAERQEFLADCSALIDSQGRKRVVGNGYYPERELAFPGCKIPVNVPRVRDREPGDGEPITFSSKIIPKYLRRTSELDELIPLLYLKGISTNDFSEVLTAMVGERVNMAPNTVLNLTSGWQKEFSEWKNRDLSEKEYIYWWVDGIYCNARNDEKSCLLVIIAAGKDGIKEPLAVEAGYRESETSWSTILAGLQQRGLNKPPKLVIGDGALGFWKALAKHFPTARQQRCWVHKTQNVLDKLPKSVHAEAKTAIHEIYLAPTKEKALVAFDHFVKTFQAKYPKAVECLIKDKETTLAFYDFPAEHWQHIRSTNVIESVFATVRLRTDRTKGCKNAPNTETMAFKLILSAQKRWRKLRGYNKIPLVLQGKIFKDGILTAAA